MKNKLTLFVVIQAILIVILIWLLTYLGRDEFNNVKADKFVSSNSQPLLKSVNGINFITLNSISKSKTVKEFCVNYSRCTR